MGRPKHESGKTGRKGHGQSKNRFRFQSFTERISRIKIDVGHRLGRDETVPEGAVTFFYQGLQRWIDLNCTEDFSAFTRQVHKVQTLNQLVHHQNLVINSLKSHLQVRNSMALLPLLDLLVQIARDLQADFYGTLLISPSSRLSCLCWTPESTEPGSPHSNHSFCLAAGSRTSSKFIADIDESTRDVAVIWADRNTSPGKLDVKDTDKARIASGSNRLQNASVLRSMLVIVSGALRLCQRMGRPSFTKDFNGGLT